MYSSETSESSPGHGIASSQAPSDSSRPLPSPGLAGGSYGAYQQQQDPLHGQPNMLYPPHSPTLPPSTSTYHDGTVNNHRDVKLDARSKEGGHTSGSKSLIPAIKKPVRTLGSGLIPSTAAWLFLVVVIVEALVVIGLVVSVFGIVVDRTATLSDDAKTVPVFLALFVFGMLFFVLVALDAFRLHNTIQIIGCVVYNIALLITAALEVGQVRDALQNQDRFGGGVPCEDRPNRRCNAVRTLYPAVKPMLIATPIIIGVAQIPLTVLTFRLWQDFGWQVYKKIGADLIKRRMMLVYQVFVVFLKFDAFFGTAFCIAFLILVSTRQDAEFALTIAAVPAAVIVLFINAFAVRREIYSLMCFCILCLMAGMGYFIYKIIRIFEPATEDRYRTVRLTLTFFSVFSIISLLATIILAIWCTINFGKGLREAHEHMGGFVGSLRRRRHRKTNSAHLDMGGGLTGADKQEGYAEDGRPRVNLEDGSPNYEAPSSPPTVASSPHRVANGVPASPSQRVHLTGSPAYESYPHSQGSFPRRGSYRPQQQQQQTYQSSVFSQETMPTSPTLAAYPSSGGYYGAGHASQKPSLSRRISLD